VAEISYFQVTEQGEKTMIPCKICGSDWHNEEDCPLAPDIEEKIFELPHHKDNELTVPPGKQYLLPPPREDEEAWVFRGA